MSIDNRLDMNMKQIEDLAESVIHLKGMLEPVMVAELNDPKNDNPPDTKHYCSVELNLIHQSEKIAVVQKMVKDTISRLAISEGKVI